MATKASPDVRSRQAPNADRQRLSGIGLRGGDRHDLLTDGEIACASDRRYSTDRR